MAYRVDKTEEFTKVTEDENENPLMLRVFVGARWTFVEDYEDKKTAQYKRSEKGMCTIAVEGVEEESWVHEEDGEFMVYRGYSVD